MNTELRKKAENDLKKDFIKLMSNSVFRKTMGYVRKHKDIKLLANKPRKNYLVSEPNYHATAFFP